MIAIMFRTWYVLKHILIIAYTNILGIIQRNTFENFKKITIYNQGPVSKAPQNTLTCGFLLCI